METNALNILLVEDDFITQHVETTMLRKLGCHVDVASNGNTALEMIKTKNTEYDLIFMDIGLGDMTGNDVIRIIRDMDHEIHNIPIVALTGYICTSDQNACLEAGANEVACKPITYEALQTILNHYSKRKYLKKQPDNKSRGCPFPSPLVH
jgi:two-component system aerobic respiration control sensor histidine kinase ArcB